MPILPEPTNDALPMKSQIQKFVSEVIAFLKDLDDRVRALEPKPRATKAAPDSPTSPPKE